MSPAPPPDPRDRVQVVQGDITKLEVDAVVNAANTSLLGGGGVDGAIHRAAGPGLVQECRMLGGGRVGQAKLTSGHDLPARHVIHTVGPVWQGGGAGEDELLQSCYRNSLQLAAEHGLRTVAFPAISTGVYRFPPERAAGVAVREVLRFLGGNRLPERVVLVALGAEAYQYYLTALSGNAI
ncbi:MAG TPA: O-acetyl-ADP-ribose deacetylase [Longimicrobiaceae bacterium]|nr:O-acetyl-ADP-ribose deacetylase [Longimicrobiaceae bacterium]